MMQAEGKQLTIKALCKVVKQQWAAKHGTVPASDVLKLQLLAKVSILHVGGQFVLLLKHLQFQTLQVSGRLQCQSLSSVSLVFVLNGDGSCRSTSMPRLYTAGSEA